jgi:hypothetical protein
VWLSQKSRDELNGHPKQKHPNFQEAFFGISVDIPTFGMLFLGYPLTLHGGGFAGWEV